MCTCTHCCSVTTLQPTLLWAPCSPPGSSVHGISQARILSGLSFPSPGTLTTQGSNPSLLYWQAVSLPLSHQGSPCVNTQLYHLQLLLNITTDLHLYSERQTRSCCHPHFTSDEEDDNDGEDETNYLHSSSVCHVPCAVLNASSVLTQLFLQAVTHAILYICLPSASPS